MADDKIIEKLAKLLRHQQSAQDIGNVEEAAAFAGKIQELLTAHKLEMSDIQLEQREKTESVDQEYVTATDAGAKREARRIEWQEDLSWQIARANGCKTIVTNASNSVWFVGRTTDRQLASALFKHFVKMALDMAAVEAERHRADGRAILQNRWGSYYSGAQLTAWLKTYRKSFCRGFSQALQTRISQIWNEAQEAKRKAEGENCSALVHVRKDAEAIDEYLAERFKGGSGSKRKDNIDDDENVNAHGYHSGYQSGSAVALTPNALGSSSAKEIA